MIAADQIVDELTELGLIGHDTPANRNRYAHNWAYLTKNDSMAIDEVARTLAEQRGFPLAMADVNHGIDETPLDDLNVDNDSSATEI